MPPTALIFGAAGQDGFYLQELLQRENVRVIATSRRDPVLPGDVGDFARVEALVAEYRPDYIFHLAANSSTRHEVVFENQRSIVDGSLHVLEAAKRHTPQARIFLAGSALQFENRGRPIDESTPFAATSAYSAQRIASVYTARYYREQHQLGVYVGYFFHHDSPRRGPHHVAQKVAQAARRIAAGSSEKLEMGSLEVWKEWTFAGDAMAAIWLLVNQTRYFEAVIGSGDARSIGDWVAEAFAGLGLDWRQHVHSTPGFVPEYPKLVSDPARLRALGWQPQVSFPDLAKLMVRA
ncbi:MAG: GDP-mannose 4,6-dehydratase [Lacunisphaera sp.]